MLLDMERAFLEFDLDTEPHLVLAVMVLAEPELMILKKLTSTFVKKYNSVLLKIFKLRYCYLWLHYSVISVKAVNKTKTTN